MNRPSWDEYFLKILDTISGRSTCGRGKIACLIVSSDHYVLATGYCGSPKGMPHCEDVGHQFVKVKENDGELKLHCIRTLHAEQNAVAQAAKRGISLDGGTAYVTMEPCYSCAKLLVQCGIKRVVAKHAYQSAELTRELFTKLNISYSILNPIYLYQD